MPTPTLCLSNGFLCRANQTYAWRIRRNACVLFPLLIMPERLAQSVQYKDGRVLQQSGNSARSANKSWQSGSGFATGKRRPIELLSDQFPRAKVRTQRSCSSQWKRIMHFMYKFLTKSWSLFPVALITSGQLYFKDVPDIFRSTLLARHKRWCIYLLQVLSREKCWNKVRKWHPGSRDGPVNRWQSIHHYNPVRGSS